MKESIDKQKYYTDHWKYYKEEKRLEVLIPDKFRNKIWAEEFGKLYGLVEQSDIQKIDLDFALTTWVDPIPLISLIILFRQALSVEKSNVRIFLPDIKENRQTSQLDNPKVLLKFFLEEGFLDEFHEIGEINGCDTDEKFETLKKDISELAIELNYLNCHLVKVRIKNSSLIHEDINDEIFYSEIDSIIEEIRVNLLNKKIPVNQFNNILYKIRLFFSETINNVFQHAYPGKEKKFFGIYVRYRYGLQNNSVDSYLSKLKNLIQLECEHSSRKFLDCAESIYHLREGCVEIFIIDNGRGIAESTGYRQAEKHPTRKAYYDILNAQVKNQNEKNGIKSRTKNGGLYVIGKHIEESNDFILFKDREDWLASVLPDVTWNNYWDPISARDGIHTPGAIIQATLSWHSVGTGDVNFWNSVKNQDDIQILLSKYKIKIGNSELLNPYLIIDKRLNKFPSFANKQDFVPQTFHEKQEEIKAIIYLPERGMTKHLIAFKILPIIAEQLSDSTSVIIADIPDEERLIYYEAFRETVFKNLKEADFLKKIKNIILVSSSLSVCAFDVIQQKTIYKESIQDDFLKTYGPGINVAILLEILITYDSLAIWMEVKLKNQLDVFVNTRVKWTDSEYLDEYLDFNRLSRIPNFVKLFLYNIKRFSGLLPNKKLRFVNIDSLSERLSNLMNGICNPDSKNFFIVYLGSVYVKGFTLNEAVGNSENTIVIHCFQHPYLVDKLGAKSSDAAILSKLFYWPKKEWIDKNFPRISDDMDYQRIGRTPAIAPGGYHYFPIPRYRQNDTSFYFLSPKENYLIWQNPYIGLQLGHFKYGKHYDLIKINIPAFLEKSFLEKSKLAKFLVANFFYATGGSDIDAEILDKDYQDSTREFDYLEYYRFCKAIVYPNHNTTCLVVEKIREILHPRLLERVFSLNYIRNDNVKTNHLFSPLNFEEIKKCITDDQTDILFFDDVIVSGRTRKEIKNLLFSFGAREVKTLAIIDRQRIPFCVPNEQTSKFFCRLDIPRLGSTTDIIITSLEKAYNSTFLLESTRHFINQWRERWEFCTNEDGYNKNSLYPISITPVKKKFGTKKIENDYQQIGGERNKLLLTNSIGLTTYCLEVFCMTGRDDVFLKELGHVDDPRIKIELICCTLLLYCQELKLSIKLELLKILLTESNNPKCDSYSSLAAVTILSQDKKLIIELSQLPVAKENCNTDIQISLAIQTHESTESIKITDSYNNYISNLKVQNNQGFLNIADFHRQIYEKKKTHISPLYAIINEKNGKDFRIIKLQVGLEKLLWHCTYLLPAYQIESDQLIESVRRCYELH